MNTWKSLSFTLLILMAVTLSMSSMPWKKTSGAEASSVSPFPATGEIEGFTVDGPYVFHKKGRVIVKSIKLINTAYKILEEEFSTNQEVPAIECQMDSKGGLSFKINIRPKHEPPPTVYEQPEKLVAISDIEGNFHALIASLKGNRVIDEQLNWSFGKGHLVLGGDFFDRGTNVTACLWLIYELEAQAKQAGGMVHFIIGNHEEMNMRGDLRYVRNKYKIVAKKMNMPYKSLYGESTELGRWLRSKNVIEKIGSTLFVHGGISPRISDNNLQLSKINEIARTNYGKDKWRVKQKGGLPQLIFGNDGPMWYRGYFSDGLDQQAIDNICLKYGAKRIVVGHTIVNEISTLFDERIFAIDVKHITMIDKRAANALLMDGNKLYKIDVDGKRHSIGPLVTTNTLQVFKDIKNNQKQRVEEFIEKGSGIDDYYSNENITMLHYAIKHDKLDVVRVLIERGADPDRFYQDKTALMFAIKEGKGKVVRYLLHKGVNVNTQNFRRKTALYYAAKYGTPEIAQLLVEHGAKIHHKDYKSRSPIEYALQHKNTPVADYLKSLR